MLDAIDQLFERSNYPLKNLGGRDIGAGHLRGWGLEFTPVIHDRLAEDPVFQAAIQASRDRGSLLTPHKLENLYLIIRYAMSDGDIYEFGSFCGGSAVFMASILKSLEIPAKVFAFDTFEGMPKTDAVRDLHGQGDFAETGYSELLTYIEEQGLADHIETVKGEFNTTLPAILRRGGKVGLAHVDCDIYEPIKYVVRETIPSMSAAAHIVFDDPLHGSCLGAFDAVQEVVIRDLGLTAEQAYPHLVFRGPGLSDA